MKSLRPINENLVITVQEEETTQSSGGIYIPDSAKERPSKGEVVAVPANWDYSISVGDTIIYRKYSGNEVSLDGADYLILSIEDVLATVG
ncbi:MAG: co-chaperone GroES [bacterium]|nr:co-chaperone GroES [bacterium]